MRFDGRNFDEMRNVKITRGFTKYAEGSVLIEVGDTKVICTASVDNKVPPFLKGSGKGWITCEYSMIPRSTGTRKQRDISKLKMDGRSMEIQRLIGRALRSVVDLNMLGEKSILIDCDVIQADGGTRTASITGSFVALIDAINNMHRDEPFANYPVKSFVSAVSVGIVEGEALLDLCYAEDSKAKVDMNIVMTDMGQFIEIQGTGEESPFSQEELDKLLSLGKLGIQHSVKIQKECLGEDASLIGGN